MAAGGALLLHPAAPAYCGGHDPNRRAADVLSRIASRATLFECILPPGRIDGRSVAGVAVAFRRTRARQVRQVGVDLLCGDPHAGIGERGPRRAVAGVYHGRACSRGLYLSRFVFGTEMAASRLT